MRREQLEHAIRTACQITGQTEVIVVGSQAILGSYPDYELSTVATRSMKVDILPVADDNDTTIELADLIVGVAGELSRFEHTHGFSIDGVDLTTSVLPAGWRDRLIKVQKANTAAVGGDPQFIGWCLDKEDLCVAKLCAFREKDRNFVAALIDEDLVNVAVIVARLSTVDAQYTSSIQRADGWLTFRRKPTT
jgi:hypothetical protein